MLSHFKVPFTLDYQVKIIGYCYHLVDVITSGLPQSDHIKWLLLYFTNNLLKYNLCYFKDKKLLLSLKGNMNYTLNPLSKWPFPRPPARTWALMTYSLQGNCLGMASASCELVATLNFWTVTSNSWHNPFDWYSNRFRWRRGTWRCAALVLRKKRRDAIEVIFSNSRPEHLFTG